MELVLESSPARPRNFTCLQALDKGLETLAPTSGFTARLAGNISYGSTLFGERFAQKYTS
jgi:hypothetical protein